MRNPYSTRVFLSAAAIGAAGGVLAIALNWIFIAINTTPLATLAIVAVFGVWVLPGMLSQLLFRAPGIALFTMIVRRRALRVPARSRRPRPPRDGRAVTIRLLLSCAAIAVVLGLASIPNAYLLNTLAVTVPWALEAATVMYLLPGMLAQAALRRGGVGLLTQTLAGLVAAPFVPTGIAALVAWVLLGALIELPFLVGLYRYWKPWLFWVSGAVVAAFYTIFWGIFYDTPAPAPPGLRRVVGSSLQTG